MLAGRDPPAPPWRTDPGWRQLVAVHRLDPFDPAESEELLAHAGVVPPARPHLVTLGRGHPLTMALLADLAASGEVPDTLADAPDLISALLESFLRDVPSDAHLTGLATCAIAWLTTEDLLAQLVGADAAAVWRWLARLPFITAGPRGLSAHDLARDVLDAEFERRAPERYRAYRRIIYAHAVAGLRAATGLDRQLHAQQLFFLLRNSPLAAAISALRAQGSATVVAGPPGRTRPGVRDHRTVRRTGQRRARPGLALRTARTPQRGAHRRRRRRVRLPRAVPQRVGAGGPRPGRAGHARPHRPGRTTAPRGTRRHLPLLRPEPADTNATRTPCWPGTSPASSNWLTRPLAWSFVVAVDDRGRRHPSSTTWAFAPLVEVDVGGMRHVAYGIDWRRLPVDAWLDLMRERGHSGQTGPPPAALLRPPPLDRARFAAAVKTALQTLHRPDQLATNPLLGSALAATATGPDAGQLRTTIEDAVAHLGNQPKGDQLRAVLHRTYLRPAPTQEAAAEVLDLPLSTYRRHLAKALEHLTDLLWTVEIGDLHLPAQPTSR